MQSGEKTEFKLLREQAGLTLEEAARIVKVSSRSAYRYENGECKPSALAMSMLQLMADCSREQHGNAKFRFIDLFAGIGGLRLGFEAIGGKCVFSSEWDRFSRDTYVKNFRDGDEHVFGGDIREFTKDEASLNQIPAHDVLVAGFPCQPFSIAGVSKKNALGRPHGFMCDTQGTLFFDVAQIIDYHKPTAFLLENVKNLVSHDRGKTFATIKHVLEKELHYRISWRVIGSSPWVPQNRERIFIVGFKKKNGFDLEYMPLPDKAGPTLGSILESSPADKYTLTPKLWEYLQGYKKKHAAKGNGFGYSVFGPKDVTRTLSARYYKDGSEVLVSQGPQKRPRRLTPRECARLMGFEYGKRKWDIPVSDTQAYRQFGNAVVVPVVESVARYMEPWLIEALESNLQSVNDLSLSRMEPEVVTANG
ncbi:MAG: DNA (cytosine-5-)-methyltransferase [Planctomycetaceae bacterium]|nr:DNA (cytosine-5-)-methyltransferase [Planctomycetaceae bacterium]